jgi:hypothetical protein
MHVVALLGPFHRLHPSLVITRLVNSAAVGATAMQKRRGTLDGMREMTQRQAQPTDSPALTPPARGIFKVVTVSRVHHHTQRREGRDNSQNACMYCHECSRLDMTGY